MKAFDPDVVTYAPRFLPVEEIALMPSIDDKHIMGLQQKMYINMLNINKKPAQNLFQQYEAP